MLQGVTGSCDVMGLCPLVAVRVLEWGISFTHPFRRRALHASVRLPITVRGLFPSNLGQTELLHWVNVVLGIRKVTCPELFS